MSPVGILQHFEPPLTEVHGVGPEEDDPLLAHVVVHVEDVGGGEIVLQSLPLV